jgi:hypothetical protein
MAVHRNRVIYQSEALFISPDATGYHHTGLSGYGLMTPPIDAAQVSGDVLNGRGQLVGWKCGDTWPKWNGDGKNSEAGAGIKASVNTQGNTLGFTKTVVGDFATEIEFIQGGLGATYLAAGDGKITISADIAGTATVTDIFGELTGASAAVMALAGLSVLQSGGTGTVAATTSSQFVFTNATIGLVGGTLVDQVTIILEDTGGGSGALATSTWTSGTKTLRIQLNNIGVVPLITCADVISYFLSTAGQILLGTMSSATGGVIATVALRSGVVGSTIAADDLNVLTSGGSDPQAASAAGAVPTVGGAKATIYAPAHGSIINQLKRVQTANYGFTVNRQDVNQFGQLARLDSIVIDSPTVNLDFSYYLVDGYNERQLEFVTDGTTNSFSGHLSPEMYQAGNNYFILTVPEARDAVNGDMNLYKDGRDNQKTVISLGNGYMTDYSVDISVGGIPTASVTVEGMNIQSTFGETGNNLPAIDMVNGNLVSDAWDGGVKGACKADGCTGLFSLPAASSGYTGCGDVAALRPGDIVINLSNSSLISKQVSGSTSNPTVGSAHIQSASISLPMGRTTLQRLGSTFGFSKSLDVPINTTLSISAILSDLKEGKLTDLICGCETDQLEIIIYDPECNDCTTKDGAVAMRYIFKGARLESESFSSTIGDNKTVDLTFTAQVGGPDDPNNGVYISGRESADAAIKGFPPAWTGLNGSENDPVNGNLLGYRK